MLRIQLLGSFEITDDGRPVPGLAKSRVQALLAYLLLHRHSPQPREYLAYLFWPESSESQARTNLRREWHQLRRAMAPTGDFLRSPDSQSIQWNTDLPLALDVADFEEALTEAVRSDSPQSRGEQLQRAVALYRGDLLPALYDDWILPKREELRQRYIRALEQLIALLAAQRDYPCAVQMAQRLLRYDPLHEAAYRQLIELYALQNDRARALHTYHTCATVLERELGVPPSAETQALHERLLGAGAAAEVTPPAPTPDTSSRLVGRNPEWQTLLAAWRGSHKGRAHVVLIDGEAGIGKTRLAEELLEWVSRQGIAAARTRAYAAEGSLAFAPIIEWLRSPALRAGLASLDDAWRVEVARVLPDLPVDSSHLTPSLPLAQNWQRQRLFEALARVFLADEKPMLLLIDDLQWCDRETLEWLRYLLRFAPAARLLVVGTARREEARQDHPLHELERALRSAEQLTTIALAPMTADETATLATQVGGRPLDMAAAARLYAESEGNPLFVVEMVQAGYHERDAGADDQPTVDPRLPASGAALPARVRAVIESRLAQLSPTAQRLAGLAATIGRSFTFEVVLAACKEDEDAVTNGLDELWRRRIIREQGIHRYDFSHDRIRDVAYAEVSPMQRVFFHRRIAEALEGGRGELDAFSDELAVHCERANLPLKAIHYHQRAAAIARRAFANEDAIAHLARSVQLLRALPETADRNRQELALQIDLSAALQAARGMAAPEVEAAYRRAEELARTVGEPLALFPARWGWWVFQFSLSASAALQIGQELLASATKWQDPALILQAHHALWTSSFVTGDFPAALMHCEQGQTIYRPETHHAQLYVYGGHDAGLCSLSFAALTRWTLGYPDQALETIQRALDLSRQFTHPAALAQPLYLSAILHQLHRDAPAVQRQAEAAHHLRRQHGIMTAWPGWDACLLGWVAGMEGQEAAGIAQTTRGLEESARAGSRLLNAYFMTLLAELYGRVGQLERALQTLDAALALAKQTGEQWWSADMHRLRGELLRAQGDDRAAEQAYLQAIEIARGQQARSLELRATVALCRLWRHGGPPSQARQILSEIYGWFTEGFDTCDLRAARELLTQMS